VTASAGLFDTRGATAGSYALLIGWGRQWTSRLSTNVALGPQVTDENWSAAANLGLNYQIGRDLIVSLTFTQGASLVVGETEPEWATTLSGSVSYQATRVLQLAGFGGIGRTAPLNDFTSSDATTNYAAGLSASYQINAWLACSLRYQFTLEQGSIGGDILDNQVILGLTVSYPLVF
jgi:hypothetical protein